jgi:diguanylate cyclase (GGDEF)-like protein/PAS domain S-box-containing protein
VDLASIRPTERFEQSVLPMAALGLDGRVLFVNQALCELVGRPREVVTGVVVDHLCEQALDRASLTETLAEARSGAAGGQFRLRLRGAAGDRRSVRGAWSLMRDDAGAPRYLTAVLIDETDRVRAERALAESEARFRARFEQSSVPQAMLDLAGRLTAVNDAYCRLVGRSADELVGSSLESTSHPSDDGTALAAVRRLLAGETDNVQAEPLVAGPDGCPVPVLLDVTLLRDGGSPVGAAAVAQDLTTLRTAEQRHRQQEELFLALSQRASDAAVVLDAKGRLLYASPAVEHVLGYDPVRDVVGELGWDFVHPEDEPRLRAVFERLVARGGTDTLTIRVRDRSGAWRWVEETATNLLDTAVAGVVCNLRDVTEQVEAERALRESESRFRAIAETAHEGIWAVAPDGRTLYANARTGELLGLPVAELYERPVADVLGPDAAARLHDHLPTAGAERHELTYPHPDGAPRRLLVATSPLRGADGETEGSLAMVSDVTERRRAEEELRRAALHDALTGLPNRALLLDRLEHALARESIGTAVLFVDLDQFKLVNDSRGHAAGDVLLVAAAERLRRAVRPGDTVARFGGDEFVVVCEDVVEAQAVDLAAEALAALEEPLLLDDGVVHVSASVGVAVSPAASGDDLLRYADTAMYAAKAAGRRRVRLFDRALSSEAEERYAVAAQLRVALPREELELHYQPVVELETGRVLGVEALARWDSPVLGPVPPSRFVPVADLTGLAAELDSWAVRRALREAAELKRAGALAPEAYIGVNLSARNLADGGLERLLVEAADASGLAPADVVLEITESALVDDAQDAAQLLRRLRAHGFGVAVDDFGTGYSSLSYLRNLPITILKIDRSFVSEIGQDADSLAIVASIVDLARAVGVDTVAEGVETAEQAALLRRLGCSAGQGWLWTRAMSPANARHAGWAHGVAPAADLPAVAPRGRRLVAPVTAEHGLDRLLELHHEGASLATVAAALNAEGYRTPDGVRWHRTSVARTIAGSAYPALAGAEHEPTG